jgi:hypothetical protein
MSPKRKNAAAQLDSRQENDSDNYENDMPSWNDEPADFALWHNKLPEYLTDHDDSFLSLVQYGHVWSKHIMVFASTNHIHRYRQNLLSTGSFTAPLIVTRTSIGTLAHTPIDLADDSLATATKDAETNELKRFGLGPEQIDKKDKEMARAIVRKMSNPSSRKDWLKRANHSGRALLELLQIERTRLDGDLQTGIGENVVERTSTTSSATASPKRPSPASAPSTTNSLSFWTSSQARSGPHTRNPSWPASTSPPSRLSATASSPNWTPN